jgi:hypothetical protein
MDLVFRDVLLFEYGIMNVCLEGWAGLKTIFILYDWERLNLRFNFVMYP